MKYLVVIENGGNSFGAYVPDLPGCDVVGETRDEALQLIREAVMLHVNSLREEGRAGGGPGRPARARGLRKQMNTVMRKRYSGGKYKSIGADIYTRELSTSIPRRRVSA
jgi:predicted RNase H-like HicB family nuclease